MDNGSHKRSYSNLGATAGLFVALLLWLAAVSCFSVFYFASGHDSLKQWFFSMNSCFYRQASFTTEFFTADVKGTGNVFAVTGMAVSLGLIIYLLARRRHYFPAAQRETRVKNVGIKWYAYLPVVLAGAAAWYWGQSIVKPGPDEIFSAVNCAELPTFQTIAYYMLPNNHIYFNAVNSLIYHCLHTNTVVTGRLLSSVAYCGLLCMVFRWFMRRIGRMAWAYIALLPFILQFMPWAFGFQARGYEWQLLCGWVAFQSIFDYLDTGEIGYLRINTVFCVTGFALIPTFLYYYAAQVMFVLIMQVSRTRVDLRFWRHLVFCIAGVFLLYLPALCFSGQHALTANDYVKKAQFTTTFFAAWLDASRFYLGLVFSSVFPEHSPVAVVLCLVPLLLGFSRRKEDRTILLFYITLWAVWAAISLYMQRLPFARNLILHYSLTLLIVVYTLYSGIGWLTGRIKRLILSNVLKVLLFCVSVVVLTAQTACRGYLNAHYFLYFIDVNNEYDLYNKEISDIPANRTVACSEERYCFYYYCRERGYRISRCPLGNEDYYVKSQEEKIPMNVARDYQLIRIGQEGDEIYKHK